MNGKSRMDISTTIDQVIFMLIQSAARSDTLREHSYIAFLFQVLIVVAYPLRADPGKTCERWKAKVR